jgi:putative transposase
VKANQAVFRVSMSARAREDVALSARIHEIHRRSRGAYGAPMIQAELADDHGIRVGCKRVARLMRAAALRGISPRRFVTTTVRDGISVAAVDLVERQFKAESPDQLWVADITYLPTWSGFLYLAIVLDVWSRKIVGWAMESHLRSELVLAALDTALAQRRPDTVVHHSDRGCQSGLKESSQHWFVEAIINDSVTSLQVFSIQVPFSADHSMSQRLH